MKFNEICERVEKIRRMAGDFEAAHAEEDKLMVDFIESLARDGGWVGRYAREVLKVREIEFNRVCS